MIFNDKAYFYLTLPPNNQNNRQWAESNVCYGLETTLHDQNILVWCAISANRVYGSYYYEDNVNQNNYLNMLKTIFWPKVLKIGDYKKY